MTYEQLIAKIVRIERVAQAQKESAYFEYVRANARFQRGDIISDSVDTIEIIIRSYRVHNGEVEILYGGPLLTKKGRPRKDGERRWICESRITKYKYGEEIK